MSADLLAAFGIPETNRHLKRPTSEVGNSPNQEPATVAEPAEEVPWILQSKPIPQLRREQPSEALWKQDKVGTSVLFDASDDEQHEEDDFGDFEEAPKAVNSKVATRSLPKPDLVQQQNTTTDLLSLGDFDDMHISQPSDSVPYRTIKHTSGYDRTNTQLSPQAQPGQFPSFDLQARNIWEDEVAAPPNVSHENLKHERQPVTEDFESGDEEWGNFEKVEVEVGKTAVQPIQSRKPVSKQSSTEDQPQEEDDWDTFEDNPPPSAHQTRPQPPISANTSAKSPISAKPHPPPLSHPRPTNIPPPSTLLQLLPKLYQHLTQQSRLSVPPPALPSLTLQLYVTTAHVISGRIHRWKRDPLLSQSTRISQAGIKNTGMKLTALDKSETVKEDQEAEEVVAAWQRHAATLNAVMLKAKVQRPPMSLSASMAVRMGSGAGVLSAKECCAVCGLKRNERVTGIDVRVEDSFGEFWVEHWGHRDCYEFWYLYEGMLDKR